MTDSGLFAEAHDLVLSYGSTPAIRASSFTIPAGVVTAVIGPNGSGKSTLLSALTGLVPIVGGELKVLGSTPEESRSRISYVLQATPVSTGMPITVREAVAMGRYPRLGLFRRLSRDDNQAIDAAITRMNLTSLVGRHLHELSGGQRQRVLVAQGLAQPHDALLLDEPLTGLDITSARTIDELIHHRGDAPDDEGVSIVLTTHDLDEARAADWVILVSGEVVAAGPPVQACSRRNLEQAFGLGSLHDWEGFIDDPHAH